MTAVPDSSDPGSAVPDSVVSVVPAVSVAFVLGSAVLEPEAAERSLP